MRTCNNIADFPAKIPAKILASFPAYAVTETGEVWSKHSGRWKQLKPRPGKYGHGRLVLRNGGMPRHVCVHSLVLEAFVGPCPPGFEACHEDGDPRNNNKTNLRWDTHKNNMLDSRRHHTSPEGERHPRARLTPEEDIHAIKTAAKNGQPISSIAHDFRVTDGHISNIVHGRLWKDTHTNIQPDKKYYEKGANHHGAKLSELDVITIRSLFEKGASMKEIAQAFPVSNASIRLIVRRKLWKHIP